MVAAISEESVTDSVGEGRRERKKRELHTHIYDVARELFLEHGFEVTTVEQIAQAADIAPATFFNHFQNKSAVLQEMTTEVSDYIEAIVKREFEKSQTARICIHGFAERVADEIEGARGLARDVLFELMRTTSRPGDAVPYLARLQRPFARLLRIGQENGEVRRDRTPEFLAEMVLGSLNTPVTNWMNNESYPFRKRMHETAAFICEAIQPKDGAA